MRDEHTQIGSNLFPALTWMVPEELKNQVDSSVVVVEDPDAPLPSPVVHGLYYGLSAEKMGLDNTEMGLVGGTQEARQRAGFQYGQNRYRTGAEAGNGSRYAQILLPGRRSARGAMGEGVDSGNGKADER
ncbi:hypothetical protein MMC30_009294 [Trapelia coarctata]|nr:hypothetical protein [Trapelia coarctata]